MTNRRAVLEVLSCLGFDLVELLPGRVLSKGGEVRVRRGLIGIEPHLPELLVPATISVAGSTVVVADGTVDDGAATTGAVVEALELGAATVVGLESPLQAASSSRTANGTTDFRAALG